MSTISCDISEWQNVNVNSTYPYDWLILRCCDGAHYDLRADANSAWARSAKASGRIDGWTAYVVYRPGLNAQVMAQLARLGSLDYVMIDIESWQGQIAGDHSADINALATSIAGLVGTGKVWGYGNLGDLGSIWPNRPSWVQMIASGYSSTQPVVPNQIGWQYTNGSENHTAMPASAAPFGACDHNQLFFDVHTAQGGGTLIEGEDMTPAEWTTMTNLINSAVANGVKDQLNEYFANGEGRPQGGRIYQADTNALKDYFATGEGRPSTGRIGQAVAPGTTGYQSVVAAARDALKAGPSA